MDDGRNLTFLSCKDDRNGNESAFGEDNIRFQKLDQLLGFSESPDNTEGVGEVLQTKIAAELSGRNSMVWNAESLNEFFLNAVVGTDLVNIIIKLFQAR